jgi:hypothetical protein
MDKVLTLSAVLMSGYGWLESFLARRIQAGPAGKKARQGKENGKESVAGNWILFSRFDERWSQHIRRAG